MTRRECSQVAPKLLQSSQKARLELGANFLRARSVLAVLAVPDRDSCGKPDTSGTPGGTLSIAIRTGTRCARRTQV
jgi:hypothetical protein